mgnify:CR=1 FL=1
MNDDFYYALITGWVVLSLFWASIIIFIMIRKPPKSKLTKKTLILSVLLSLIALILIHLFR